MQSDQIWLFEVNVCTFSFQNKLLSFKIKLHFHWFQKILKLFSSFTRDLWQQQEKPAGLDISQLMLT